MSLPGGISKSRFDNKTLRILTGTPLPIRYIAKTSYYGMSLLISARVKVPLLLSAG